MATAAAANGQSALGVLHWAADRWIGFKYIDRANHVLDSLRGIAEVVRYEMLRDTLDVVSDPARKFDAISCVAAALNELCHLLRPIRPHRFITAGVADVTHVANEVVDRAGAREGHPAQAHRTADFDRGQLAIR